MITEIYIGSERLDLYQDENISITSSVLNIQDIQKNTTDYSRSFTVPASDRNNRIFKHYYNANIDNTFDARTTVDGRIDLGGIGFRKGKFLLQEVNVKGGVADSYVINFWGNLVSIKDKLGNDKLSDLNLSEWNHDYNSETVKTLLEGVGSYPAIIYTLLVKKQLYYNSDLNDETMTEQLANIHYRPDSINGLKWNDLKPSLNLYQIIEAIRNDYGLEFSDDFFGTDTFKNLYMWLDNKEDKKAGEQSRICDFSDGDSDNIDFGTDIGTFPVIGNSKYWRLFNSVTPDEGYEDIEYTIKFYSDSGSLSGTKTGRGVLTLDSLLDGTGFDNNTHTYNSYWEIDSDSEFKYTCSLAQFEYSGIVVVGTWNTTGSGFVSSYVDVSKVIPDLKIIDFLKGIFNAYKLVVVPLDDGSIYVDTVQNYYASGDVIDVSNYIDASSYKVKRMDIKSEINLTFKEPKTILNDQFLRDNNKAYGDEEAELRDNNGKLFEGDSFDIELPFEQIVYERLEDRNEVDDIKVLYGAIIDRELKPVKPEPHIFYRQRYEVGGDGIGFIKEDETKVAITGEINSSSHVIDDDNPTDSFIFSQEFNEFNGSLIVNTLFLKYHKDYVDSIFDEKKRIFRFRTKILPLSIVLELTLNDQLRIKESYYRINNFTVNLRTGETEFELINL